MNSFCLATGIKVFSRPEWIKRKVSDTFTADFRVMGNSIIYSSPKGRADLEGVQNSAALKEEVKKHVSGGNGPYIQIQDYAGMKGSTLAARSYFISKANHDKRLTSIIFCNLSTPLSIAVKIGNRFNTSDRAIHIARHYSDAIKLAVELCDPQDLTPDVAAINIKECFGNIDCFLSLTELLSDDAWKVQTPEFTNSTVVIDQRIMHSISEGYFEEKHIQPVECLRNLCQSAISDDSKIEYMVVDYSKLSGVSHLARVNYMKSLKNWHHQFPFKMYIVYGANAFTRTALHLARPLMPFQFKIANDISHAFRLIRDDSSGNLLKKHEIQKSEKSAAVTHEDIENLLAFVGSINWELDGIDYSFHTGVDHPFYLLHQSIKLVKEELDDLFTERKKNEEALRESETRYRSMMESMKDAAYISSPELRCEYMNPAMVERVGKDATGELCHKAIYDRDEKCSWCVFDQIEQREFVDYEVADHKTDRYYSVNNSPVVHADGTISKLTIFRDITEIKATEESLRQAQKMESIGTLASGIAHDFNNILFPIIGNADMLLMDSPEDSPFRDGLNEIYTSALRAKDLVRQILTFSRQDTTELILMKMQPIIKEVLKLIRSTIPTTIDIIQDVNADCGIIKADPTQIHQIVMNLATNAYHAMEETGGELKLSLKEVELGEHDLIIPDMIPGVYACLAVADTGTGMDKTITQKIFDPFFTTKEKGKGTGMGLSVVHGIVKSMNGSIHVYSEPGKGTEFKVYFPVDKSLSGEPNIQTKEPVRGGSERILLVDDEAAIIALGKQILERLGYQVTSRTSSIEALEAFRANPDTFDMVITDMAMPNMPGDKLAAELAKIRPEIPILLCTGFSETISKENAASLGFKGFILKPIMIKDFANKIREVLGEN